MKNFQKDKTYISAYSRKGILDNDIILFYVKVDKGYNGFIAVGQVGKDMEKNTDNIRVFLDKNLNRYITELYSISICDDPIRISEFNDVIKDANVGINGSTRFAMTYMRGECVFTEIPFQHLGVEIVRKMFETPLSSMACTDDESEKVLEQGSEDEMDNAESEVENDAGSEAEDDADTPESDIVSDQHSEAGSDGESESDDECNDCDAEDNHPDLESEKSDSDNDSVIVIELGSGSSDMDSEENGSDEEDDDDNKIVNNIPVMLLTCRNLKRSIKRLKKNSNKVETVLRHYKYCSDCDITNNNSHELQMTLNQIKAKSIEFAEEDYDDCLRAYGMMEGYPEDIKKQHVKIYYMKDDDDYTGDVLIEYTSKIETIIEIVEVAKLRVKGKKRKSRESDDKKKRR